MKIKSFGIIFLLILVGATGYIYSNRYLFFKYLPAVVDNGQLQNISGKLCDESGKPFNGRCKEISDDYMYIYSYSEGELYGLNVVYYKDNIKEIGHWKDGKQNGIFQMYTEDGILIDNANFENGERNGLTEQYYNDTGKIRVSAHYRDGILEGEFKQYYPNGQLQAETKYLNGEFDGDYKEYYENGNVRLYGVYKNGGKDGTMTFYGENKVIKSMYDFKDGMLDGIKEDYYDNGNLWTRAEFKNNVQEGVYEIYYEDGTPQLKAFIKNGQLFEEQRFNRDGTLHQVQEINQENINMDSVGSEDIIIKEIEE